MDNNIQINDTLRTEVNWDGESIRLWQAHEGGGPRDMVFIMDKQHAMELISAIKKAAEGNGWDIG